METADIIATAAIKKRIAVQQCGLTDLIKCWPRGHTTGVLQSSKLSVPVTSIDGFFGAFYSKQYFCLMVFYVFLY